jgi:hypothetical protein
MKRVFKKTIYIRLFKKENEMRLTAIQGDNSESMDSLLPVLLKKKDVLPVKLSSSLSKVIVGLFLACFLSLLLLPCHTQQHTFKKKMVCLICLYEDSSLFIHHTSLFFLSIVWIKILFIIHRYFLFSLKRKFSFGNRDPPF